MPSPDFDHRFRLLKVVANAAGMRTHAAQEVATGRQVMVHVLDDADPDAGVALERRLARLPDLDRKRVLDTATLPGGFAVVTEPIAGLTSFPAWVAARAPDDPPRAAGQRSAEDDDTDTAESPAPGAPGALGRDTDADPPLAVEFMIGGEGSTGEFTRLYLASGRLNLETSPTRPPPKELFGWVPGEGTPPGSYTQTFGPAARPGAGAAPVRPRTGARATPL
ncbi:MAG TPA: hypothetical protein VGD56_09140, partial [Gemmatirosa sp.]